MSLLSIDEFYHDLRQEFLAGSEASMDFSESEFALDLTKELIESGQIEGFEPCHYKAPKGMRVDGYWFKEDEECLDLFILDFSNRDSLETLVRTEVESIFKRLENFVTASMMKQIYNDLEITSPGYGLSRDISERKMNFSRVNFYLISERRLSERIHSIEEVKYSSWIFSYHIWDISRFYRLYTSKGEKEELLIDFTDWRPEGLQCLPAHLSTAEYQSYLLVIPGEILSALYGKYGARLLEQNVRCFLQARGNVNKGIRATILNSPEMFFAYNNGLTATAKEIEFDEKESGIYIKKIRDLQIVNGGQTTASLFHTNRKDKASVDKIFVQVKLSVINEEQSEEVVPKISEYANTQNKVNAADFFSNHPFHVRIEDFSRRLYAPPQQSALRETKWFYERARGQYADAMAKLSPSDTKKFQVQNPKSQMFTKTDLAKFENVWDEKPTFVNLGAQKNFAKYAARIGQEWEKDSDRFNEFYFKCIVAKAIIFKNTEKIISSQSWYSGGYRANIVAYTLALISLYCSKNNKSLHYANIWDKQNISQAMIKTIENVGKIVHDDILRPPSGISNISEWCKKDGCWDRLIDETFSRSNIFPADFIKELVSKNEVREVVREAKKTQKMDNSIEEQINILKYSPEQWKYVFRESKKIGVLSPKEMSILESSTYKLPSEKQAHILLGILKKLEMEGLKIT